jgi:hypothetical protein
MKRREFIVNSLKVVSAGAVVPWALVEASQKVSAGDGPAPASNDGTGAKKAGPAKVRSSAAVEEFGVVGFRQDFFGTLTVTPFAADPTVPGGAGHSRVTYNGRDNPFNQDWVKRNVQLAAYRIHKNDVHVTPEAYFPAILGSRYSRVVQVIDGKTLIVDFEYNGGKPDAPQVSREVSGYFFIDCAPALRNMVENPNRPDQFVFKAGSTYVIKGMPNIPFLAKGQHGDMHWVSSDPKRRASLKISAEDAIGYRPVGGRDAKPSQIPSGAFFELDTHNHSIYLNRLDIIGPTYTAPVVQPQWRAVMFSYARGQCARTLEIRDCNTFAEKEAHEASGATLPKGANWLAPGITGIVGGGGIRGDRGDGVIDMLDYQRFNLIGSSWIAWCVHSIKNNDGAGNWITIDGEDLDEQGRPVNMVYEAQYVKRNRFPDVKVSFHDFEGDGRARGVRIESDDFSWPMLFNQYWTGGTSTSLAEPTRMTIDGFTLYFGNNGDWRRELQKGGATRGICDASEAELFDRIPRVGDAITIEKADGGAWRAWGWGLQEGDVLQQGNQKFVIDSRKRKQSSGTLLGVANPPGQGGYAHYWEITFKDNAVPNGEQPKLTVVSSRTAYLLDGKPRTATMIYDQDLHGHWQYNRSEVNYSYRNICFNGNYRCTAGPADSGDKGYQGLWEFPSAQEWINCWAMDTDGSTRGTPAHESRSEAFDKLVLQKRNVHPQSRKHDHHILVDGGHMFAQRLTNKQSPVWLRNHPELIHGTGSFGEPRLCNPVLLDKKGVGIGEHGLSISLVEGYTLDLSNSTFLDQSVATTLDVCGNGTLILDNVHFPQITNAKSGRAEAGGIRTSFANGLQKDRFKLHIRGDNGAGGFRLVGDPEDAGITLTNWTLGQMIFTRSPIDLSKGWQAVPDINHKITVNGKPLGDVA